MNIFQIISALLVLIVLILLVRYAWGIFFDSNYKPVAWQHACKEDRVGKELISLERSYPDKVRFFNWWFQVERLKRDGVPGDFAELGVYKGESAKIIHLMDPSRTFHLYDTFEGFKEEDLKEETGEAASYTTKNFADTSLEAVKRFLGEEGRFVYHVGRFKRSPVSGLRSPVDGDLNSDTKPPTADRRPPTANRFSLSSTSTPTCTFQPKPALNIFIRCYLQEGLSSSMIIITSGPGSLKLSMNSLQQSRKIL